MFDSNSNYALNKRDPEAIVYHSATDRPIRLTRKDFASEEEFLNWKNWSNEDYHSEEKRNHIQDNHTLPLVELSKKVAVSDGPENIVQKQFEKLELEQSSAEAIAFMKAHLTEKQFRRLWKHFGEGLSIAAIANQEGKAHSSVSESINTAKKILISCAKNPTFRLKKRR